jgi:hypothetical protein
MGPIVITQARAAGEVEFIQNYASLLSELS